VLTFAAGCFSIAGGEWKGHEVSRVKSTDGTSDAVLIEGSAGATTGITSLVFVVASGTESDQSSKDFDRDRAVFRADKVTGLSLDWERPNLLEIRFRKARIFNFTNFADLFADDGSTRVEIKLVPLDPDSALTAAQNTPK
jgi:hypothetical protein